jgi:hypothetical protein
MWQIDSAISLTRYGPSNFIHPARIWSASDDHVYGINPDVGAPLGYVLTIGVPNRPGFVQAPRALYPNDGDLSEPMAMIYKGEAEVNGAMRLKVWFPEYQDEPTWALQTQGFPLAQPHWLGIDAILEDGIAWYVARVRVLEI